MTQLLVLSLNPALDLEWRVDGFRVDEKNSILAETRSAGGKGVNVARWLQFLGSKPELVVPLGGDTGRELAQCLRSERLPAHIIRLREATRVNVIVTTDAGRQMRFNPLGPKLSRAEWRGVLKRVQEKLTCLISNGGANVRASRNCLCTSGARGCSPNREQLAKALLILSGSLPRGVPVKAYAQLIRLAHRLGVRTLLDCDGLAFAAAVKSRPFLVKPNEHELAQWWRKPLRSETELVRAARALSDQTGGWVLVSRGAKRSLLVNYRERFQCAAAPPQVRTVNTVGAGDALLAAVARQLQLGAPSREWLLSGVSVGSAATQYSAGQLPR